MGHLSDRWESESPDSQEFCFEITSEVWHDFVEYFGDDEDIASSDKYLISAILTLANAVTRMEMRNAPKRGDA